MEEKAPKVFRTYDPLYQKGFPRWVGYAAFAGLLALIMAPFYFFMQTAKDAFILTEVIASILALAFFFIYRNKKRYLGGAEITVGRELIEIRFPDQKYQHKIISMNTLKKIWICDNSADKMGTEAPVPALLYVYLYSSSSVGRVRLYFSETTGRRFVSAIFRNKAPKQKKERRFLKHLGNKAETYYF